MNIKYFILAIATVAAAAARSAGAHVGSSSSQSSVNGTNNASVPALSSDKILNGTLTAAQEKKLLDQLSSDLNVHKRKLQSCFNDMLLVNDLSGSLTARYEVVKSVSKEIITDLFAKQGALSGVNVADVSVGVISFSNYAKDIVTLGTPTSKDLQGLLNAVSNMPFIGGGTYIRTAFTLVQNQLQKYQPGRPILIPIVSDYNDAAVQDAMRVVNSILASYGVNVVFMCLGVNGGSGVNQGFMAEICPNEKNRFYYPNIDVFKANGPGDVARAYCSELATIAPTVADTNAPSTANTESPVMTFSPSSAPTPNVTEIGKPPHWCDSHLWVCVPWYLLLPGFRWKNFKSKEEVVEALEQQRNTEQASMTASRAALLELAKPKAGINPILNREAILSLSPQQEQSARERAEQFRRDTAALREAQDSDAALARSNTAHLPTQLQNRGGSFTTSGLLVHQDRRNLPPDFGVGQEIEREKTPPPIEVPAAPKEKLERKVMSSLLIVTAITLAIDAIRGLDKPVLEIENADPIGRAINGMVNAANSLVGRKAAELAPYGEVTPKPSNDGHSGHELA